MPPRSSHSRTPRRGGTDPRLDPVVTPLRGESRGSGVGSGEGRHGGERGAGERGGLADARRYTPRARSVREANPRAVSASRDPFRPALQVLKGGAEAPPRRGSAGRTPAGSTTTDLPAPARRAAPTRRTSPARPDTPGHRDSPARRPTPPRRTGATRRPARKPRRPYRLGDGARRLRLSGLLVLVLFVVIGGRLVQLQLTDAQAYAARGLRDRLQTVPLAAPRGAIVDRDGAVLAHSVEARYVYADPGLVSDPERTADALIPLLGIARSELLPKLSPHPFADGRAVRFEYLARGVDVAIGDQISGLNLAGIGVRQDERREVPGHDLAANLIGFTGNDLSGLAGIESGYDQLLRGVEGQRTFEIGDGRLATEIPGGYHVETPARPGTSLQLTIDRDLQFEVQHLLFQRMRTVNATFGSAVVLDVHTGEVLAQASYPGYDAAEPFHSPVEVRGDSNIDVTVDPGSVCKVVAISAALDEGVIAPDAAVVVGPTVRKGDQTYSDTHPFPSGTRLTLPGILAYSSNVGTIGIADQLGAQKLYDYQRRYGLGEATGEGLPGESPGLVQPPANWSGSSYGSIPIGNGISVTPLQMAAVYAAIANDGEWVQPHLVRATVGADNRATPVAAPARHRVISATTAAELRTMLQAVVTVPGATGLSAAIPGYQVAGKTGTGLRVMNGRYIPGEVASFVGMAPAENPRYVIGVFAHTPVGTGGAVAAPAFHDMMSFALAHFRVPPSGAPVPTFVLKK